MNCKTIFFLCLLIAPSIAHAAEPVPLSMQESIDIALKQSAAIHSATEGVSAAESRKKEAFTG
jgi:hypothetical protein